MTDRATKTSSAAGRRPAPARRRQSRGTRPAEKSPRVRLAGRVFFWSAMGVVAFGMLPLAIIAIIGIAQGTVPSEADGGIIGSAPGFPLLQPPFWLLWLPALGMLALTVITWPFPSRFPAYFWGARFDMSIISLVGLLTTLVAAVAYEAPQASIVFAAAGAFFVAMVVFGIRGAIEYVRDIRDLRRPVRR